MSEKSKKISMSSELRHYNVFVDIKRGRLEISDYSQDGHKGSDLLLVLLKKMGFRLDVQTDSPCG